MEQNNSETVCEKEGLIGVGVGGGASSVGGSGAAAGDVGGGVRNHRHIQQRISSLEVFMKNHPHIEHLDQLQRNQLAWILELDPQLVNLWCQNKRTQVKNPGAHEEYEALRIENEVLGAKKKLYTQAVRLQNLRLKEENEKLKSALARILTGLNP